MINERPSQNVDMFKRVYLSFVNDIERQHSDHYNNNSVKHNNISANTNCLNASDGVSGLRLLS